MNYCPYCQLPLETPVSQCPSCFADLSAPSGQPPALPPGGPAARSGGTMVESADSVREAIRAQQGGAAPPPLVKPLSGPVQAPPVPKPGTTPVKPMPPKAGRGADTSGDAQLFRPVNRPPTINICVLDDGSREEGEWFRVRDDTFTIGRTEGDVVIPHDESMSGKHAEIVRREQDGNYRFYLRDLSSMNGTFVRVAKASLKEGQEVMVGSRRYYFDPGAEGKQQEQEQSRGESSSTRGWQSVSSSDITKHLPSLVEMRPEGDGVRLSIQDVENLLGSDGGQCSMVIHGDPFVSPVHALVFRDDRGKMFIKNQSSLNGIWLRVAEAPLASNGEFQLGEQRFLVRQQ